FDETRDNDLLSKLRAELPGILAWAVKGAVAWHSNGLVPPDAVADATADYRAESDPLAGFIADRCIEGDQFRVRAAAIYGEYGTWAAEQHLRHDEVLSSTAFGRRLRERYQKTRTATGIVYQGLGLRFASDLDV